MINKMKLKIALSLIHDIEPDSKESKIIKHHVSKNILHVDGRSDIERIARRLEVKRLRAEINEIYGRQLYGERLNVHISDIEAEVENDG